MRSVIYALFGASFTLVTAWSLGALLLRKLSLHRLEQRLLAIVTGSACLSAIVFLLCTAGLARKGTYLVLGLLAIVFATRSGARHAPGLRRPPAEPHEPQSRLWKSLFIAAFIALTALYVFRDLPPAANLGGITQRLSMLDRARGFNSGTTWPDAAQLLLLPAFALGRDSAAALVNLGLLATLALLMFCYGRRVGNPIVGAAGAILIYAYPLASQYFPAPNIDAATAVALFSLFYLLQLSDQPPVPLAISIGVLVGFSYAADRLAIMAFPCVIGFMIWKLWRQRRPILSVPAPGRQLLLAATAFALPSLPNQNTRFLICLIPFALLALGMALSSLPWLIRNAGPNARRFWRATFRMPGSAPDQPTASRIIPAWLTQFAAASFILAYFVYFAGDGLHAHFIHDDPANIAYYWSHGVWALIRAQFVFFSTYIRPMGGLFYLPIYHFAGFHPLPYRAVGLLLILANTALFYRVAKLVSGSARVAWLAAILACYHPFLMDMIYQNSNIYDVLCFLFYFAALGCYLGIRARGQFLNWPQTALFAALYIGALDSKEMAVTLPLTLALFELLFHPPAGIAVKTMLAWLNREGRAACIAALLTAVYLAGKTLGPDPLTDISAYQPELTVQKFIASITANIQTLFYLPQWFGPGYVFGALTAFLAFAWVKRSRFVAFCVLFAILSELPIAFLGRSGSCLYIPLAAWSMLVSAAVWAAVRIVASVFRRHAVCRVATAALVAAFLFWNGRQVQSETQRMRGYFDESQAVTWSVIQQLEKLQINPKPGARMVFLHDPLPIPTTLFIAQLRFQDPTLNVLLTAAPPTEQELAPMDYIFDYRDGQFIQIKPLPQ